MGLEKTNRAVVFPGQGSQHVGMGKILADKYTAAREVFEEVDDALGESLFKLMCEGPEDELVLTRNAQPALMAVSMAMVRVVEAESGKKIDGLVDYVAGHSLGEYSALAAAGAINLRDVAKLLRLRGESMQAAVPVGEGAMAALLGADIETTLEIINIASTEGVCDIANDNAPGQVVISGHISAISKAIDLSSTFGVRKAILLPVSAPFHCSMMRPASVLMAKALVKIDIHSPIVPLVTNISAVAIDGSALEIRESLVDQITNMVRWRESILWMSGQGVSTVIEMGAGKVLTGLNKRINKNLIAISLQESNDVDKFIAELNC
jgi:[acyl-carrier-protein] S-malonyltransferase